MTLEQTDDGGLNIPLELHALSYGPEAGALFGESGVVHSVLRSCLYLEGANGKIAGVVSASEPDGPLALRVAGLDGALRVLEDGGGQSFVGDGASIVIQGRVTINLRQARPWMRPPVGAGPRACPLSLPGCLGGKPTGQARGPAPTGIHALSRIIIDKGAKSGLGPLAASLGGEAVSYDDAMLVLASRSLEAFNDAWRARDEVGTAKAAVSLLGLGPGLTPSGDDLLAGLLAVVKWAQPWSERAATIGAALSQTIAKEAPTRTTKLSARLLTHAVNGLLYEPAMQLGTALFADDRDLIEPAALRLFAVGHSSGTDTAVGILLGALLTDDEQGVGSRE